jgi:hypothetical protein
VFGRRGMEAVQRDWYSAWLTQCCSQDHLDIRQVEETWPAAETAAATVGRFSDRGPIALRKSASVALTGFMTRPV